MARLVIQIDSSPPAPVTIVKWELADSTVAHIASDSGSVGRLTAVAPGKLPAFVANGTSYPAVYYCDTGNVCAMIGEVDILP